MDYLYGNLTLGARQDYILPIASQTTLGGVKVDGKTIFISEDGTISCAPPSGERERERVTKLSKLTGDQLRVEFVDHANLYKQIVNNEININDCKLYFMMCSRKRGRRFYWWHPENYNAKKPGTANPSNFRLGYGNIANTPVHPGVESEVIKIKKFPEVPNWMPNNGFLETEIPLSLNDIKIGSKTINCAYYFLPMIKPVIKAERTDTNFWKDSKIAFISTKSSEDQKTLIPFICSFALCINGEVGYFNNYLRLGFRHEHSKKIYLDEQFSSPIVYLSSLYREIT